MPRSKRTQQTEGKEKIDPFVELWHPIIAYEHISRYELASTALHGRVLDLGCGYGYGCKVMTRSETINEIVGLDIDISKKLVDYQGHEFICADAHNLPFKNNAFGSIVCAGLIEHVEEPQKVLSEAKRVLCRGGKILVSTPNKKYFIRLIYKAMLNAMGLRVSHFSNPYHKKEYSCPELKKSLGAIFVIEKIEGQSIFPPLGGGSLISVLTQLPASLWKATISIGKHFPSLSRDIVILCKKA